MWLKIKATMSKGSRRNDEEHCNVLEYQVLNVGKRLLMKSFVHVGEQNDFEFDSLWNWKPVQVKKDKGNMVILAGMCNKSSSSILYWIKLFNDIFRNTV